MRDKREEKKEMKYQKDKCYARWILELEDKSMTVEKM